MLAHHKIVLYALAIHTRPNGAMCAGFYTIAEDCGKITKQEVRRIVRHLARKGYAEYHKGLITDEGEFAGAGYCITNLGLAALDQEDGR